MKDKILTKILSSILCASLTMQIGWEATREQVNAAGTMGVSSVGNGTVLEIDTTDSGTSDFYIRSKQGGGYQIENHSPASGALSYTDLTEINTLKINGWAVARIYTDIETAIEFSNTQAMLYVVEGTLTATSISGNGYQFSVYEDGTLNCNQFNGAIFSSFGAVIIYGTITANSIDLSSNPSNFFSSDDTKYHVSSSFINGTKDLYGTVIAEPNTTISSSGGSFTLQVGSATKEITGSFTNKKPADLFDDPFTFDTVSDLYYGQDYDFSDLITVADGYDKSVTLEYSSDGVNYSTTKPTAQSPNNYYVRAVAPDSGTFLGKTTDPQTYNINYLDYSDLFPSGSKTYSSVSGIVNGKYVPGNLVLSLPDGVLIKGYSFASDKDFSNSITLTPEDVLIGTDYNGDEIVRGYPNQDALIQLRRAGDKATTNGNISLFQVYPDIKNLVYDLLDPDIWLYTVDGKETSEDDKLIGDVVEIHVYDDNLKEIYINGKLYESYEEGRFASALIEDDYFPDDEDFEPEYITLSLSSVVGKATDYTIKAVDYAGRETEFSFTLFPNTTDALISVTVPVGPIYAGDDYDVDVKTNSDGKVTLQYKDADTDTVLSSKPTAEGNYTVTATAAETDFYFKATTSANYSIKKRTPDTTVTVPGIVYVGNDYAVEADTDSDGNITYQYYDKNNGSYLSSKPTSAGEYTVTVSTPETSKYYSSEDSASFKIIKRDPTITLSVPDTTVGQTYAPEFVTNSDSTSITYEYKMEGASDSTYTKTKPTAAGSYTIRVTVGSTDKFNEASATDNFTISKKAASVSLGIGTPYAGTTYTPSFSSNSDAASRAVFEYKEKNADDSKYSKTAPNTVGTYVVRVTIPETESYAETIVTADFRIIYLNTPQTSYVIEGQSGKNNYYVSDVVLKAPTGFTISAVYGGTYTDSIPYKDGITSVYLKRTSDGALTNAIPIANAPRVDKSAPSISTPNGSIAPGSVIFTADFTLNVSDPNLRSLKVNGEPIDLTNYKNGYTLTLNPGYGSQTYKVMAEDEAGNVTTLEFTLKAEWLKDKVIIPDVVLPLEGNESYNLGDGYWLVTRNTPSGPVTDKTVYSGNMPFYVKEGGDYTFTKVT